MCHFFNIHSTTDEHLDCFIETVNPFHWNTVLLEQCHNIQEGADDIEFSFPLNIYSEMELLVIIFLIFLGILHTVFHSDCTNLHSHKEGTSVFFSTQPHQCLVSVVFLRKIFYLFTWLCLVAAWGSSVFIVTCKLLAATCVISSSLKWKWKWKSSRLVVSDSLRPCGLQPTTLLRPWDFPGKSTGVGCLNQGSNPGPWIGSVES